MKKQCILIVGPTITFDNQLCDRLEKKALLLKSVDIKRIDSILTHNIVDLLIIEISSRNPSKVDIIKNLRMRYPSTYILLINGNGNRDLIAKSFHSGVNDSFRKPLNLTLLEEKVEAILKKKKTDLINL